MATDIEINYDLESVTSMVQDLNSSLTDVDGRVVDLEGRVQQLEVSGNQEIDIIYEIKNISHAIVMGMWCCFHSFLLLVETRHLCGKELINNVISNVRWDVCGDKENSTF